MLFQYGQGPSGVTNRNRQFFFSGANPTVDILTNGRNVASSQYTVNNYTMVSSVQTTTNTSYINGAIFVTTTPVAMSPNIGTNAPFFIGGGLPIDSSTPGIALTGNIAEILIYSSVLSTTERQQVEGYLAWKWGLYDLLVAGHPYKLLNSPSNVPNLALWLDAADSSTLSFSSGTNVSQWRDKSGNGRNMSPTTNVFQYTSAFNGSYPTLSSSITGGNGLIGSISAFTLPNPSTIFAVFQNRGVNSGTSSYPFLFDVTNGSTNRTFAFAYNQGGSADIIQIGSGGASSMSTDTPSTSNMATAQVYTMNIGTSSTLLYTNGNLTSTVTLSGATVSSGTLSIGGRGSNNQWTGYFCEFMIFTTALTTTQRQQIEGYLAWKWGLQGSLPAGHPYQVSSGAIVRPFSRQFVPTDVSVPCLLWFDGQDASSVTGTTSVTRWKDKSGNANDLTFSGNIPSYEPSTGYVSVGILGNYGTATSAVTFSSPTASSIFSVANATFPNNIGTYTSLRFTPSGGGVLPQFAHAMIARASSNGYYIERNSGGTYQFLGLTSYSLNTSISGNGTTVSYTTYAGFGADNLTAGTSVAIISTPGLTATMSISTITGNGTAVTVTFATAHPFSVGQHISISGVSVNGYNTVNAAGTGTNSATLVVVQSVPSSTTITYANTTTAAASGGTVVGTYDGVYSATSYISGVLTYPNKITATSPDFLTVTGASATGSVVTVNFTNPVAGTPILFAPGQIMFVSGIVGGGTSPFNFNTSNSDQRVISATATSVSYWSTLASAGATYTSGGTIRSVISLPQAFNNYNAISSTIRVDATNITLSTAGNAINSSMSSSTGNTGTHPFIISSSVPSNIGEIIVYDGALSTQERQKVEGYLMWKWGSQRVVRTGTYLSFPTSHPSYQFPPAATTPFDPRVLGRLALWLDGADSTTITGSGTSSFSWTDKSTRRISTTLTPTPNSTTYPTSTTITTANGDTRNAVNIPQANNTVANGIVFTLQPWGAVADGIAGQGTVFVASSQISGTAGTGVGLSNGTSYGIYSYSYSNQASGIGTSVGVVGVSAMSYAPSTATSVTSLSIISASSTGISEFFVVGGLLKAGGFTTITRDGVNPPVASFTAGSNIMTLSVANQFIVPGMTITAGFITTTSATVTSISGLLVTLSQTAISDQSLTSSYTASSSVAATIPSGTYVTALSGTAPNYTITLSQAISITTANTPLSFVSNNATNTNSGSTSLSLGFNPFTSGSFLTTLAVSGTGGGSATLSVNGGTVSVTSSSPIGITSTTATPTFTLSNGQTSSYNLFEMIHYNRFLSFTERQQVEGYLAWKWGLQGNLPASHSYKKYPV